MSLSLYPIARIIFEPFFSILGLKVKGMEHIPQKGGVMLVSNHISNWDPLILGVAVKHREVSFMAKEEIFKIPVLKQLALGVGAFPVRRGKADRQALKKAIEVLGEGKLLGLFPEGTRSKTKELLPFQPGAAMIGIKAKAPIIPTIIVGSNRLFSLRRDKLLVRFGQPLYYDYENSTSEQLQQITEDLTGIIKEMLAQENTVQL